MINLRNSPFLWLALLLLLAIAVSGKMGNEFSATVKIILGLVCLCSALFTVIRYRPAHQYLSTLFIGVLIFVAGLLRVDEFRTEIYPGDMLTTSFFMEGVVIVQQVLKNKETTVSIKCKNISLASGEKTGTLKYTDKYLLLSIKKNTELNFLPGDVIGVKGYVSSIREPLNPYAFDARIHYNTLGIRHSMYCKGEEMNLEYPVEHSASRMTAKWQFFLSSLVRQHTRKEVAQLTNALVWGDRSDMEDDVRDAFADSGAMHVLSVSGMHVAIIYSMLLFMLGPPGAGSLFQRLFRFGIYTVAILLYVGLAGACPAVVRAGLMIILFLFGKAMGWNTLIWNLLGFAAFMMFWLNPFIWQNIGFQLSFLAMAGILLFAKPMIRSLAFKQIILHRLWEITALSITAQVFILPVLLGQFHQFPLTFIISSFVAIPAAYIVMGGALLNVILSMTGIHFLWPIVDWSGHLFIVTMKWMSGLNPLMHYSLPSISAWSLMIMAILFSLALVFKWPGGRLIAYGFGGLTFFSLGCHRISQWSTSEIIIFHHFKGLVLDVVEDGRCISIYDCSLSPASIGFATRNYRCERDIISVRVLCTGQDFEKPTVKYSDNELKTRTNNILFWKNQPADISSEGELTHIIIEECDDPAVLIEFACMNNSPLIIIPAHLDRKLRTSMIEMFSANALKYHDIDQQGYFRIKT